MSKTERDGTFREIRDLIEGRYNDLAAAGQPWVSSWITKWVLNIYADVLEGAPEGKARFWRHCAHHTLTGMVAAALRRRTDPTKVRCDQLVFRDFPRVQAYYNVAREIDGETERVGVPVLQLLPQERTAKVVELRTSGRALLEHADQLAHFFREHYDEEGRPA